MREQQMKNIDIGFAEVIKGLEAKRDLLKEEFQTKYDAESSRFEEKMGTLEVYSGDIANIESIYDDLSKFIERSSDAKMLTKITEVSEFIQKSIENLEQIGKAKGFDKADTQIEPGLTPLSLNVEKVMSIIAKFNMLPPQAQKPESGE